MKSSNNLTFFGAQRKKYLDLKKNSENGICFLISPNLTTKRNSPLTEKGSFLLYLDCLVWNLGTIFCMEIEENYDVVIFCEKNCTFLFGRTVWITPNGIEKKLAMLIKFSR